MKRFFSTMAEVVSNKVQVGDTISAMDRKEYVITSLHPDLGMAIARREDENDSRKPIMLVCWTIHNGDIGTD